MHFDGTLFKLKEALDALATPVYVLTGRRPWSIGYYTAKKSAINAAIDGGAVRIGKLLPAHFGVAIDERIVEYPWLFEKLRRGEQSIGRILDAGSTLNHDYILDRSPLNRANLTIMTLAPEKRCYWYKGYSYVFGDFRRTNFRDASFDTIISISTLEHVGLDNTMLYTDDPKKAEMDQAGFVDAIVEFKRILAPGGRCLITVPYGVSENFRWFQVFNKKMIRSLIDGFSPSSLEMEFFRYDKSGWQRASEVSAADAVAYDPHSGRGRQEDRAGCARAVACIQMIK